MNIPDNRKILVLAKWGDTSNSKQARCEWRVATQENGLIWSGYGFGYDTTQWAELPERAA